MIDTPRPTRQVVHQPTREVVRRQLDPVSADTLLALKALADRYRQLAVQVDALTTRLDHAVRQVSPALRAAFGVGPDTAAQLLITAGSNPERLYSERSFSALCGSAHVARLLRS